MRNGSDSIRLAIIGCGAVTQKGHLPALLRLFPHFKVAVLIDVERAPLLARQFPDPPVCQREIGDLSGKVDVALVATPPHTHREIVCALLRQGVHVLCEKPLGRTVAECRAMLEATKDENGSLYVAYNRRHFRSWRLLRELVERGTAGHLVALYYEEGSVFNWPVASRTVFDPILSGGGVLLDSGVHALDLALWLTKGMPSVIHYEDDYRGGVEANALVILGLGDQTINIRLSRTHALLNRVIAVFQAAVVSVECWNGNSVHILSWNRDVEREIRRIFTTLEKSLPPDPFEAQLLSLWHCLHGEGTFPGGEEGIHSVELVEKCYQARHLMTYPWLYVKDGAK